MLPGSCFESGDFVVGCNYWASHAGTAMWSDWRAEVVDDDLRRLADGKLQVLRVFPLWPVFQPIRLLSGGRGEPVEYRFGEESLPDTAAGRAGVDESALGKFSEFLTIAEKYDLRVIVGLITGWMSGRLFLPPAFDGCDPLTDAECIKWQIRFVKQFVTTFRGCDAIIGWEPGNECDMLGHACNAEAWLWMSSIVDAIKVSDNTRPVLSGMHSLTLDQANTWTIQQQGELVDVMTSHPYPVFVPCCDQDPLDTIRTTLHGTAESRLYADISGKPCIAEELGTLGNMFASDEVGARFIRSSLFSLWAHDCHGLLWWCAHEQTELEHAPYDWYGQERELGLMRSDKSRKPVFDVITKFRTQLDSLGFDRLGPRIVDAVCILTKDQKNWPIAYSSFVLAKQAGIDIKYQYAEQRIEESDCYFMPCVRGARPLSRTRWLELLERVEQGATLYMSYDVALMSGFEEVFGLEVQFRAKRPSPSEMIMNKQHMPIDGEYYMSVKETRAAVLAREENGNPIFTCCDYGKGKAYFLGFPMEMKLAEQPGVFHLPGAGAYWQIYKTVAESIRTRRVAEKSSPCVGITEHVLGEGRRLITLINYSSEEVKPNLELRGNWKVSATYIGSSDSIGPNDAAVLEIGVAPVGSSKVIGSASDAVKSLLKA